MGLIIIDGIKTKIPSDEVLVVKTEDKEIFKICIFTIRNTRYEVLANQEYNVSAFDDKVLPKCLFQILLDHKIIKHVLENGKTVSKKFNIAKIYNKEVF